MFNNYQFELGTAKKWCSHNPKKPLVDFWIWKAGKQPIKANKSKML